MKKRIAYAHLAIAVVGVGGIVLFATYSASISSRPSKPFFIDTQPIADLHAHIHESDDSPDDIGHHELSRSLPFIAPYDLWITGIDWQVENAPRETLHHLALFRMDERNRACPNRNGQEVLVSGQDSMFNPSLRLPIGHAFYISKGTPLVLFAAMHNPLPPLGPGGEFDDVFVRTIVHTVPAENEKGFLPVTTRILYLDETGCDLAFSPETFTVPAQTQNYRYSGPTEGANPARTTFYATSTILYMGAHLHGWQGGKTVSVYKNAQHFDTFATVRLEDSAYLFKTPHYPMRHMLVPGDTIAIEALYENPHTSPIRGAMGFLALYLSE